MSCQEGHPGGVEHAARRFGCSQAGGSSGRTCSEFRKAPGGGVRAASVQNGQCIGPGCPISRRSGTLGALQAQSSQMSRQQREAACRGVLGVLVVDLFPQQREQASPSSPDCIVVATRIAGRQVWRKGPQEVVGTRRSAHGEEKPGALEVGQQWELLQ